MRIRRGEGETYVDFPLEDFLEERNGVEVQALIHLHYWSSKEVEPRDDSWEPGSCSACSPKEIRVGVVVDEQVLTIGCHDFHADDGFTRPAPVLYSRRFTSASFQCCSPFSSWK